MVIQGFVFKLASPWRSYSGPGLPGSDSAAIDGGAAYNGSLDGGPRHGSDASNGRQSACASDARCNGHPPS